MNNVNLKDYNKTVTYLLPLLDLEVTDFSDALVNAFCEKENKRVHVKVKMKCPTLGDLLSHKGYNHIYTEDGDSEHIIIVYDFPEKYHNEFDYFLDSSVSKFSSEAKDKIKLSNGLCQKEGDKIFCFYPPGSYEHEIIMSFFGKHIRNKELNPLWELRSEQVGFQLPEDVELMEKIDYEVELIK